MPQRKRQETLWGNWINGIFGLYAHLRRENKKTCFVWVPSIRDGNSFADLQIGRWLNILQSPLAERCHGI